MSILPPYLSDSALEDIISRALTEDVGSGDITTLSTVPEGLVCSASFLIKENGVIAGLTVAERVFEALDPDVEIFWRAADGAHVKQGETIGTIQGRAHPILTAERVALNLIQRMSGIATATRAMVDAVGPYPARILDTRKTAPGLRLLDKWAVKIGGGENHRIGLFDMVLIKDNHISAAGGVRPAVESARAYLASTRSEVKIEVEASNVEHVREIVGCEGVDIILLDNMVTREADGRVDTLRLEEALELIDGNVLTEVSGNVSIETVSAIAATGVDYISCGALTHSVSALDVSLEVSL